MRLLHAIMMGNRGMQDSINLDRPEHAGYSMQVVTEWGAPFLAITHGDITTMTPLANVVDMTAAPGATMIPCYPSEVPMPPAPKGKKK